LPVGWLFTLGCSLKTTKVGKIVVILFFHGTSVFFDKKLGGLHFLAIFSQTRMDSPE
jgi:hypothetical protein